MSAKFNTYQVVFLVDVSIGHRGSENEEDFEDLLNKTRLSALKILTFLEDTLPQAQKSTNLKWGFKFFNFSSFNTSIERYEFKDFCVRTFEQFESLIENKCVAEKSKGNEKCNAKPWTDTVSALAKALKEVVTDYQWDFPDILFSPVRPSRCRKSLKICKVEEPKQNNYVFVLGPCPQSVSGSGSEVTKEKATSDPDHIRQSILPTLVSRIFCDQKKIQLFWIDTTENDGYDKTEKCTGPRIIHEALSGLGGGLIPANSVLQLESLWNVNIETVLREDGSASAGDADKCRERCSERQGIDSDQGNKKWEISRPADLAMPLSVVMNFYLRKRFIHRNNVAKRGSIVIKRGDETREVCQVVLRSIVNETVTSHAISPQKSSEGDFNFSVCVNNVKSSTPPESISLTAGLPDAAAAKLSVNVTSRCAKSSSEENVISQQLQIRGTLPAGDIPLQCLQPNNVYAVLQKEGKTLESATNLFQLLQCLARNRLILVVDVKPGDAEYCTSATAVLQPLTQASGTLTFIKSSVTTVVEKLLIFSNVPANTNETAEKFVEKVVDHLCYPTSTRKEKAKGCVAKENYTSAMGESWLKPGILVRSADALKTKLDSDTSVESDEYNVLKKLKEFYRKERLNKAHLINRNNSGQRSPTKGTAKSVPEKPRLSHSRSFSAPSKVAKNLGARTVMIMNQAKQEVERREETKGQENKKKDNTKSIKSDGQSCSVSLQSVDIGTEEGLLQHLNDCYAKAVAEEMGTLITAQSIVQVALHFFRMKDTQKLHKTTREFVSQHLCISHDKLRNKHKSQSTSLGEKVREYELQVLLRLELEAIVYSSEAPEDGAYDDLVDEMAKLLRAVSFMKEPGYISEFLGKTVAEGYAATTPKLLQELFDEMGQPLPASFEGLFSPSGSSNSVSLSSVKSDNPSVITDSVYNFMKPSSDRTLRTRSFKKLPSFTAAPSNRQIVVSKQGGMQNKDKKLKEEKRRRTTTGTHSGKAKSPKTETVRRNLFTDSGLGRREGGVKLERRQSVAVMETTRVLRSTPKKSPRRQSARTPKGHHVLKTKIVAETPRHKQMSRKTRAAHSRSQTAPCAEVIMESPDKVTPDIDTEASLGRRKSATGLGRKASFYDPSKKSRNVANMEKALGEKYKMLAERMTSTRMLSPGPTSLIARSKSTPPRRIRPISLFSLLSSPSPQKSPSAELRPDRHGQESNLIHSMQPNHHKLLQSRMSSSKPLVSLSPHSKSSTHVGETPPKRIQPVRLLFASPSPPKRFPGLAEAKAKGGRLMKTLSFEESPSKTNRVTFSPKPSVQPMFARDSPKKLLRTPTKAAAITGGALKSPTRSILKSPLRSPPHFNMYFTQQPSPLIGKPFDAVPSTPQGRFRVISSPSETGVTSASKSEESSPKDRLRRSARKAESSVRTPGRKQTRAVRKIFSQSDETSKEQEDIPEPDSEKTSVKTPENLKESKDSMSSCDAFSEPLGIPLSPRQATTPKKKTPVKGLQRKFSPPSDKPNKAQSNTELGIDTLPADESSFRVLREIESNMSESNSSQESDVRSPRRLVGRRRRERHASVLSLDESANLSAEDSLMSTRSKRQRSPDDSSAGDVVLNSASNTPSKKRKTSTVSDISRDSASTDYFSTSEIFAASIDLPDISSSSGCAKFARLGSNSNDFDTSQSGLLRSRLRCQLSGASDSNSNLSYDLPSSPVFTASAGPFVRNKSLDRIRSFGCDTNPSETDASSRPESPVFGKRIDELRGVTPTNLETMISGSPSKSPSPTDMSVSPAGATRSKISPGVKKYSPNVSAKGLAELIHSPLHFDAVSPSVQKVPSRRAGSSSGSKSPSSQAMRSAPSSSEPESKPRSRRSLYRTETKSAI